MTACKFQYETYELHNELANFGTKFGIFRQSFVKFTVKWEGLHSSE